VGKQDLNHPCMRIGFDAKRAFFNFSGLGNYSRNTIRSMGTRFPEHDYFLYIPKRKYRIQNGEFEKHTLVYPQSFTGRNLPWLWRSYWLGRKLREDGIELYHGLSNEIPFDMPTPGVRSVVTIHDLIYMRYPGWYKPIDRAIYIRKARHAARKADRIIAISGQTGSDIQEFIGVSPEKIDVVYQGCDPAFYSPVRDTEKSRIKEKYGLPGEYLLYVGTIEPRKNLLKIIQALEMDSHEIPLIVIGRATPYLEKVRQFIHEHSIQNIFFLRDVPNEDLPGIYQMAKIFIYPSRFEGFGIPILEALASLTPVITSTGGCFSEAGGKSTSYVDPESAEELAVTIRKILDDSQLQDSMKRDGFEHSLQFTEDRITDNIMQVYRKALQ
jgi:glycosyltransferase involved in cell wall biosynthesis